MENIQQVIEAVKTLNINFNDATTQKIAEAILPAVKMYIAYLIFSNLLVFIGLMIAVFAGYKLIKRSLN